MIQKFVSKLTIALPRANVLNNLWMFIKLIYIASEVTTCMRTCYVHENVRAWTILSSQGPVL